SRPALRVTRMAAPQRCTPSLHDALPICSGEAEVETGDPALPDADVDAGSWYAQVAVDRLDSLYFPREGHWSRLTYRRSAGWLGGDRKSTRLNSSHVKISYAVFCLKKKKH